MKPPSQVNADQERFARRRVVRYSDLLAIVREGLKSVYDSLGDDLQKVIEKGGAVRTIPLDTSGRFDEFDNRTKEFKASTDAMLAAAGAARKFELAWEEAETVARGY